MANKDFSGMNTGRANSSSAGNVYTATETSTTRKGQQGSASPQERAERADKLKTQGRKGCKAIRINMAFTPDNHEYIKVMAKISGKTMTEFANLAIERYRNEHPDLYEKAKEIINGL